MLVSGTSLINPPLATRFHDLIYSVSVSTRYLSISSPASCFLLSHVAIRPRPDHVSDVTGSRYFTLTSRAPLASLLFAFASRANGVVVAPAYPVGAGALP